MKINMDNDNISLAELRDKCDMGMDLLQCLRFVVDEKDLHLYVREPHHSLFDAIENIFKDIEAKLSDI